MCDGTRFDNQCEQITGMRRLGACKQVDFGKKII